jgi:hypothetical protein
MRHLTRWLALLSLSLTLWSTSATAESTAPTLDEIRQDPDLTPEKLIRHFAHFEFELAEKVQDPAVFFSRQIGDCDDFATLAADLLRARGYKPVLVVVFMSRETHVVCYIPEIQSYLDYNFRSSVRPLVPTSGTVADIAEKVSLSFRSPWHCAAEFTFANGQRRLGFTDFPQAPGKSPSLLAKSGRPH